MKSLTLATIVVFLSICVLHSTAFPYAEAQVQETEGNYVQTEETQQTAAAAEEMNPLVLSRTKRHFSHLPMCRYCRNCCNNKGWGFCCKF